MEIDKRNGNVCFNDLNHCYFDINDNSKKYISVTTLIGKYEQPFDEDFWSKYKALEKLLPKESWNIEKKSLLNTKKFKKEILDLYNITELEFNKTQQEILDEWDRKKNEACTRGTKIHSDIENSFYSKQKNIDVQKFGVGGKFECKKDYTDLDLEYGVYPEYLIYRESEDGILRLAGQIDLLIKNGNEITLVDHKGLPLDTPIATETGFKMMKDLNIGDRVFDKDGKLCSITAKSEVHHNPCYKITFDNSESIIADHEHRWLVIDNSTDKVLTTEQLVSGMYIETVKSLEVDIPTEGLSNVELEEFNYAKKGFIPSTNGYIKSDKRIIKSVEICDTVETQCIAVDSPSHTYCFGYTMIPTHNTNQKIDKTSGFDTKTKQNVKMKYPLNNLPDCNFYHYTMQLSTYAWMLQKVNPNFVIKDLILNHYDHSGNNTLYHCEYLKRDVERMLIDYKKQIVLENARAKRAKIDY